MYHNMMLFVCITNPMDYDVVNTLADLVKIVGMYYFGA